MRRPRRKGVLAPSHLRAGGSRRHKSQAAARTAGSTGRQGQPTRARASGTRPPAHPPPAPPPAPLPIEFWRLTGCSSAPASDLGESGRERLPLEWGFRVAGCTAGALKGAGSALKGTLSVLELPPAAAGPPRTSAGWIGLQSRGQGAGEGGWGYPEARLAQLASRAAQAPVCRPTTGWDPRQLGVGPGLTCAVVWTGSRNVAEDCDLCSSFQPVAGPWKSIRKAVSRTHGTVRQERPERAAVVPGRLHAMPPVSSLRCSIGRYLFGLGLMHHCSAGWLPTAAPARPGSDAARPCVPGACRGFGQPAATRCNCLTSPTHRATVTGALHPQWRSFRHTTPVSRAPTGQPGA